MRRFVFTLAAAALLAVLAPAAALAHHHSRGHHFGARHARFERFGDMSGRPSSSTSSGNAGTIASFTGGVLTLQLTDGSTISGAVTNDTRIECASSSQSQGSGDDDQGDQSTQSSGDDDQGEQSTQSSGDDDQGEQSTQSSGDDDQGDQSSGDDDSSSSCSSSDLKPGAAVRAAELRISGDGKSWEKVELG